MYGWILWMTNFIHPLCTSHTFMIHILFNIGFVYFPIKPLQYPKRNLTDYVCSQPVQLGKTHKNGFVTQKKTFYEWTEKYFFFRNETSACCLILFKMRTYLFGNEITNLISKPVCCNILLNEKLLSDL